MRSAVAKIVEGDGSQSGLPSSPAAPSLPLVPVARPTMPGAADVLPYLTQIDAARWYSNFGPLVKGIEQRLADRFVSPVSVVTLSSGTTALTVALRAMNVPGGSLCAMPSWTFVATAHAAIQAGLVPWFLDVDPKTWMLDPAAVRDALAGAPGPVGAIVPVCAFGDVPDLEPWAALSRDTGIPVLVDAAAAFDGLRDAPVPAIVSLHATKVLGTGEGGFVVTRDPDLAQRIKSYTSYGFRGTRESQFPAMNAKLSEYGAAVGHASLDGWPALRLRYLLAAQQLRIAFARLPQIRFQPGWGASWISSVCVVGTPDGAARHVEAVLHDAGVDTRRWWGRGCHREPAFVDCPHSELPQTERLASATVGLPFSSDLTSDEISRIAKAVGRAFAV